MGFTQFIRLVLIEEFNSRISSPISRHSEEFGDVQHWAAKSSSGYCVIFGEKLPILQQYTRATALHPSKIVESIVNVYKEKGEIVNLYTFLTK